MFAKAAVIVEDHQVPIYALKYIKDNKSFEKAKMIVIKL